MTNKNSEIIYSLTKDELSLPGFHWESKNKKICFIYVHGMACNVLEDKFVNFLGTKLSENNYGFIYGHNRGYSPINFIRTLKGYVRVIGASYEKLSECTLDVECWIDEALKRGYSDIVLIGHSLGCNKIVYYLSNINNKFVKNIILLSPSDLQKELKQTEFQDLLKKSKIMLKKNEGKKFVIENLWDELPMSANTFFELYNEKSLFHNFPINSNPRKFTQLEKLKQNLLVFYADNDDVINDPSNALKIIKEKAVNVKSFNGKIISNTNHFYENNSEILFQEILDWINAKNL